MGVSLSELISGREIEIEDFRGKTIFMDASNVMYQFLSSIRDRFTGEPLRDSHGNVTSHLSGIFYRTSKMMESGINVVYVFDGEPPKFKKKTIENRVKIRQEAQEKWKEALEEGDAEKIRKYSQAAIRLTPEMIEEAKTLLSVMGVAWMQAPSEAEAQASYLVKEARGWAVGSQDWDSLLFGAPRLAKNLTITGRRKVPRKEKYITVKPELIELDSALKNLGISRDQLIILGMLVGTDYTPGGIKGIGPKTALKIVKEHKTLSSVLKNVEWNFDIEPETVFEFFKNPPTEKKEPKASKFDKFALEEFLMKKHDFSEERVRRTIEKFTKTHDSKKQSSLGKFLKQ
ncbi:MAG: flap endonuclease-1 [Nanoarchaeota archaeon]|nr:flap endonuclease-1 [Nanoarchaeota archaeon]MBU1135007.1 flap endonuclease-1 [Nanoarchaeota archaeon]MBU2520064.1 flap endonuclease-1 [Nanoarchaeota archaeon]